MNTIRTFNLTVLLFHFRPIKVIYDSLQAVKFKYVTHNYKTVLISLYNFSLTQLQCDICEHKRVWTILIQVNQIERVRYLMNPLWLSRVAIHIFITLHWGEFCWQRFCIV